MTHIEELRDAIWRLHGANASHLKSVRVKEELGGQTVWDGVVGVFELTDFPRAKLDYAWCYEKSGRKRHVAVLHEAPVHSPKSAVRAAIVRDY